MRKTTALLDPIPAAVLALVVLPRQLSRRRPNGLTPAAFANRTRSLLTITLVSSPYSMAKR